MMLYNNNTPLYSIEDNNNGLPFFAAKYSVKDRESKMHMHEYIQIDYVYSGRAKHAVNNAVHDLIKGDIFVIPPYCKHTIEGLPDEEAVIFEFEFTPDFINQNFNNISRADGLFDFAYIKPFLKPGNSVKPRFNLTGYARAETERIYDEIFMEYLHRKPGFDLLIRALLLKLLVIVGREFSCYSDEFKTGKAHKEQRETVFNAIAYIENNYYENITLNDAAKKFMLSQSYFNHLFKHFTDKTFLEYLTAVRISKALELLDTTDKRVADICLAVGFRNVNHFNRIFKREIQMTPLMYRNKQKKDISEFS